MHITVSSRGLLVQKLKTNDLQSERTAFDGTMVYAQNKVSEGHVGALPRRAYSGLCGNWDLSNSQRHLHGPRRDSALQSALLRWGGVGDPQSQQRFLTLHCSEGTQTWEAILLPLGSPHSLARQMPLEKLSFQAPFEGHVP